MPAKTSLSKHSKVALQTLGSMIKITRLERGISQKSLAERLNVSRHTVISIEKGDPKISIGAVFEAAFTVGVPLLADDIEALQKLGGMVARLASILPKRQRQSREEIDDDF